MMAPAAAKIPWLCGNFCYFQDFFDSCFIYLYITFQINLSFTMKHEDYAKEERKDAFTFIFQGTHHLLGYIDSLGWKELVNFLYIFFVSACIVTLLVLLKKRHLELLLTTNTPSTLLILSPTCCIVCCTISSQQKQHSVGPNLF